MLKQTASKALEKSSVIGNQEALPPEERQVGAAEDKFSKTINDGLAAS